MSFTRDFTLSVYEQLLRSLVSNGYRFFTLEQFLTSQPRGKIVLLRHDVDRAPLCSLEMALLERKLGLCASYYFRIVKQSNDPEIIQAIADMDHEIGYHYEDLAMAHGNRVNAIQSFEANLEYFRKFYPVQTICMHGSPLSSWDNRTLWETYNYKEYGILGEPYFDLDFNRFFYLTDTGRCWNGNRVSVRDKVGTGQSSPFESTFDIIHDLDRLPPALMITTHPQRWENNFMPWVTELVMQQMKNSIKRLLVKS
ncbi:MAG TPA: hypothetical protein VNZ86_13890 [Bacteroidia bacterium]|jgi:hypothetical protein|nr:hypothetical protein [Bacteroidia bacterium]